jgi:integrase
MAGKAGRRSWGWIRKLPSGHWQASYTGPDARRHTAPATFATKMAAEHWLSDEHRLVERGEWTAPALRAAQRRATGVTVAEYAGTWIAQRAKIKPRTRIGYQELLARLIAPTLGALPLKSLTPDTVRAWYAGLGDDHPRRNSHAYGLLHAICATAVSPDRLIDDQPCQISGVMNPPARRSPVILSVAEVGKLADTIRPERLKALILVAAWCGLRWGELIELRRADVSVGAEMLTVTRAVTHRGGCRIDTPKSGRGRIVYVPPHVQAELKQHLDTFVAEEPGALLFGAVRGCHLNDKVFRNYLVPALAAIGQPNVRIHDLRHFAGTQTARVANLPETMGRLGHSTAKASLIYQQIAQGRDAEVAVALSRLAGG